MAHPLTHLTHGIPTRRPFHPAKTAKVLHVTDDTARHLRYTSRAKREADVSLSHRCTMEHHDATGLTPRDKRCES